MAGCRLFGGWRIWFGNHTKPTPGGAQPKRLVPEDFPHTIFGITICRAREVNSTYVYPVDSGGFEPWNRRRVGACGAGSTGGSNFTADQRSRLNGTRSAGRRAMDTGSRNPRASTRSFNLWRNHASEIRRSVNSFTAQIRSNGYNHMVDVGLWGLITGENDRAQAEPPPDLPRKQDTILPSS